MALGYQVLTLAGDNTDKIASGAAIRVHAVHLISTDADIQFYDGLAGYTAGTEIVWFHRIGDSTSKFDSKLNGLTFKNGCWIEGAAGDIVVVFFERV